MVSNPPRDNREQKLGRTVLDDLRRGGFKNTIRRDYRDLKDFYLDEDRRKRLESMGWFKRAIFITAWLLKGLFLKLTPVRRLLLIVGLVLILTSGDTGYSDGNFRININVPIVGSLLVLFVLMLELKDKLLARSELQAGRTVQHALMPERSPHVAGWSLWLFTRPANEVGGDLVDFQHVDEKRFGVTIGDVSGKGLGAALLMAKLQSTLRALAPDFGSLAKLGAKINEILHRDSLPNSFASLVYLQLQPDSGVVHLVNAGHLPPIVLRGSTFEEMPKGGTALGILPKAKYSDQRIELQNGELLLVYSDGLTEARNERDEFFGSERLMGLLPTLGGLSTEQVGKKLLAAVDQFVGDARANDDLSLVVFKRKE